MSLTTFQRVSHVKMASMYHSIPAQVGHTMQERIERKRERERGEETEMGRWKREGGKEGERRRERERERMRLMLACIITNATITVANAPSVMEKGHLVISSPCNFYFPHTITPNKTVLSCCGPTI